MHPPNTTLAVFCLMCPPKCKHYCKKIWLHSQCLSTVNAVKVKHIQNTLNVLDFMKTVMNIISIVLIHCINCSFWSKCTQRNLIKTQCECEQALSIHMFSKDQLQCTYSGYSYIPKPSKDLMQILCIQCTITHYSNNDHIICIDWNVIRKPCENEQAQTLGKLFQTGQHGLSPTSTKGMLSKFTLPHTKRDFMI